MPIAVATIYCPSTGVSDVMGKTSSQTQIQGNAGHFDRCEHRVLELGMYASVRDALPAAFRF